ncbi:M23 family metallopeptidase [Rhizobium halophytocola]|uniref:Murein DD-endopeptidase MepM/ murein hydrolase activator NlpD n=1 Tax=Rhizobium halophytocola TaxID=735519 RepID=A0ABS4DZE4_9HYPH|nr:M23 family metallopeptidase [Rhizobium halophytocola]MBP1851060.1 murein DD-endopeptidase MepM/ murein hydrolase activator NlpD [Rhizobium halophytocola]
MAVKSDRAFGKRREPHIIILAHGDQIRHMTVRPWMAALTASVLGMMAIGYLGSTSYLALRDNLIGATMARQARLQHDYEDRIAALRAQVDRVTSRQLLDQQVVETKVDKLLQQQLALTSRHGRLGELLDRAEQSGIFGPDVPVPTARPNPGNEQASAAGTSKKTARAIDRLLGNSAEAEATPDNLSLAYLPLRQTAADKADRLFSNVTRSLKSIERDQLNRMQKLTVGAQTAANQIDSILTGSGITLPDAATSADGADGAKEAALDRDSDAVGGPYLAPEPPAAFDATLGQLDDALDRLERLRDTARDLPFANPAPGRVVTSPFGNRKDPFLGRLALHPGMDFREPPGNPITSTGAGTIAVAGPAGGYGNMVEVDHGYGITTRYGHLSKILVKVGQEVEPGDVVGLAGSTGRSTGTHLHYEIRRNNRPIDPLHFLNAGMKLEGLVN